MPNLYLCRIHGINKSNARLASVRVGVAFEEEKALTPWSSTYWRRRSNDGSDSSVSSLIYGFTLIRSLQVRFGVELQIAKVEGLGELDLPILPQR